MNTATESAAPNRDEELLGQLMRQLASAANVETVLEDFCRRYPHLEAEARSYPRMQQVLQGVQPTETAHPKQLGDFRIIRQMARGGMGVIYEAIQERLKRRVVLKTMKASWDVGPARLRFRREQEVLARLHQTHIVPIHTADEAEGLHYFVMPYIDGASLNHVVEEARNHETSKADGATTSLPAIAAAWLKRSCNHESAPASTPSSDRTTDPPSTSPAKQAPQTPRELPIHYFRSVAQAIADVAEGLHYAHQEGLLHRDLKPSNVMIEPNGKCWIIDFGLAGFLNLNETVAASTSSATETESLTQGHTIGTPAYMAPEQWDQSSTLDERTDVWGLGVTLYEMLTLQRPFISHAATDSTSQKKRLQQLIVQTRPPQLSHYVRNVPADLAAICMKALEKEPSRRYASAQAFAEDLRRWLRCEPVSARPSWMLRNVWLWAKRNRGWAATLLAVALAIILVPSSFAFMQRQRSAELEREAYTQQLMHLRSVNHQVGWSEDAKQLARTGAKIGKTQKLADEYAATLGFIDAAMVKRFTDYGASSLAFDASGERLLIGGWEDEKAKLWHRKTDATVTSEHAGAGPVAFGTNGTPLQLVIKSDNPHSCILWDMEKQQLVHEFQLPEMENARTAATALASDGSLVAAAVGVSDNKGQVVVWDASTGKQVLVAEQLATALSFSPDGKFLAVGTMKGVALWSLTKSEQLAFLPSTNGVQALAFGRNPLHGGHPWRLAVGDAGSLITTWNLDKNLPVAFCRGSKYEINSVAFSADGVLLASAGRNNAKLWDVATGSLLLDLAVRNTMQAVTFSSNGKELAVCSIPVWGKKVDSDRGGVDVWELKDRRGIQTLRGLTGSIARVFFSPDDRLIAALSHDWQVGVWDVVSGRLQYIVDVPKGYWIDNFGLAFNMSTSQLACCTGRNARLYDLKTGEQIQQWPLPSGLNDHLAFHPSGKLLLFRNESEVQEAQPAPDNKKYLVCRIRDLFGQQPTTPIAEIRGFDLGVKGSSISPDGNFYVVSGLTTGASGPKGLTKAFNGVTGKELWPLPFNAKTPNPQSQFDPEGRIVSCCIQHNTTVLVEAATGKILEIREEAKVGQREFSSQKYWQGSGSNMLYHGEKPLPLAQFNFDQKTDFPDWIFNTAQTHFAWGNEDGTVSVVDIRAVQRQLAEIGLGW